MNKRMYTDINGESFALEISRDRQSITLGMEAFEACTEPPIVLDAELARIVGLELLGFGVGRGFSDEKVSNVLADQQRNVGRRP